MKKITFSRINRPPQEGFLGRPFSEDMQILADARETRSIINDREWIAADLTVQGDFLTGLLGYSEEDHFRRFEPDTWSWLKAERLSAEGASESAIVPFAVDLRSDRRWVANANSQRIQAATFAKGFSIALNAAVRALNLWPSDWDVDLITSAVTVEEWVRKHPDVRSFRRVVKHPNPGRKLSNDLKEMRELAARRKTEQFTAGYDRTLRFLDEDGGLIREVQDKLEGLDEGYLDVYIEARGPGHSVRFSSRQRSDSVYVDEYGTDWEWGMQLVLDALRTYSQNREDLS